MSFKIILEALGAIPSLLKSINKLIDEIKQYQVKKRHDELDQYQREVELIISEIKKAKNNDQRKELIARLSSASSK